MRVGKAFKLGAVVTLSTVMVASQAFHRLAAGRRPDAIETSCHAATSATARPRKTTPSVSTYGSPR